MKKFWIIAAVWTAVFILSQFLGEHSASVITTNAFDRAAVETSWSFPTINLGIYLAGLVLVYVLTGINIIKQWDCRPVLLFGKYSATKGPGFCWIDPIFHQVMEDVFMADNLDELTVTNVQTHDNVPLAFNLVLTTRITDAESNIVEVDDADASVQQRALAVVTECVGKTELDKILHDRTKLNADIQTALQTRVGSWGVKIIAVELKDIKITDPQIEQAIAQKAKAGKEAEAELVRAQMQLEIAKKLKAAASEFDEDTWRLKGMEVMLELCRSANNNTVIIPNDVVQSLTRILPFKTAA